MHIHNHPITFVTIHRSRHHHQCILGHKIPDASLTLLVALAKGFNVKFESLCAGKKQKQAAQRAQEGLEICHTVE